MPRASGSGPPGPDSASSQAELINTLEAEGIRFSLTADQDAAVTALLHELPEAGRGRSRPPEEKATQDVLDWHTRRGLRRRIC